MNTRFDVSHASALSTHDCAVSASCAPRSAGILDRLRGILYGWQQRAVDRRTLSTLDDRMLRDIGVDRIDALSEAAKPFWRR